MMRSLFLFVLATVLVFPIWALEIEQPDTRTESLVFLDAAQALYEADGRISNVESYQIVGALATNEDTIFFSDFYGGWNCQWGWILKDEVLPFDLVMAYEAAVAAGRSPQRSNYFPPYSEGRFVGRIPTAEQVARARCYHSYQRHLESIPEYQLAGGGQVISAVAVEVGTGIVLTYLVLNLVEYDGFAFMEHEIAFLQGYFWEQLGEQFSRDWNGLMQFSIAEVWAEYTAPSFTVDAVSLEVKLTSWWLSAEAARSAPRPEVEEVALKQLDLMYQAFEGAVNGSRQPGPGGRGPKIPSKEELRAAIVALCSGTVGAVASDPGQQYLAQVASDWWYSYDANQGAFAVLVQSLLRDRNLAPLDYARQQAYVQYVRNAQFAVGRIKDELGFVSSEDLSFFSTWLDQLGGRRTVVSRREAQALYALFRQVIALSPETVAEYLDADYSALWILWQFICDNQEVPLEWEEPVLDFGTIEPGEIVVGQQVSAEIQRILDAFERTGRLAVEGGTARVWVCDEYPDFALKVIEAGGAEAATAEYLMQDQIMLLGQGFPPEVADRVFIPQILIGVLDERGRFCILMERVWGIDIMDWSDPQNLQEIREVLEGAPVGEFEQAANALELWVEELHKAGYVHGDLHGGNVMLVWTGESLQVAVIDFGLAGRSTPTKVAGDLANLAVRHRAIIEIGRRVGL